MKTIKIFLNEDGSFRNGLTPDFNLNQYSWQDTLLNVYVPTSIVDLQTGSTGVVAMFKSYDSEGELVEEITDNKYNFAFVRSGIFRPNDTTEYALFERIMPKQMTLYAGQQVLVLNVVEYNLEHELTNIVTSGEQTYNVVASAIAESSEEETDLASIQAQINSLQNAIQTLTNDKQSKVDANIIVYTDKQHSTITNQVVQALNSLNGRLSPVETQVDTNTQDISDIKNSMILDIDYLGQHTSTFAPTQVTLDEVGLALKGSELENGDTIIWVEQKQDATDVIWKCTYIHSSEWIYYEIPSIESASNTSLGLIQGTRAEDGKTVAVDITNGKIVNIYVRVSTNPSTYKNVSIFASETITTLNNILNGTQAVGKATKAIQDQNGNVIDTTYMPLAVGATQQYVKDYSLPKVFNDTYFINWYDSIISSSGTPRTAQVSLSHETNTKKLKSLIWNIPTYEFDITKNNAFKFSIKYMMGDYTPVPTDTYNVGISLKLYLHKGETSTLLGNVSQTLIVRTYIDSKEFIIYPYSLTEPIKYEQGDYFEIEVWQTTMVEGDRDKNLILVSDSPSLSTATICLNYGTVAITQGVVGEEHMSISSSITYDSANNTATLNFSSYYDLVTSVVETRIFKLNLSSADETTLETNNPKLYIQLNGTTYSLRSMNDYNSLCDYTDLKRHRAYDNKTTATSTYLFKAQFEVDTFTLCETNSKSILDIENGTTIVEKAKRDQNGNVIDTTYSTKEELKDNSSIAYYHLGAYDTYVDNGDGTTTITRQTGYVDLGTENLTYTESDNKPRWYMDLSRLALLPSTQAELGQIVCSNYQVKNEGQAWQDASGISLNTNGLLVIYGSTRPIGSVQYKLATPYTEIVITDKPLNTLDQNGSQWLREEWEKGLNLWDLQNQFNVNGAGVPSQNASLNKTLGIGTYTITFTKARISGVTITNDSLYDVYIKDYDNDINYYGGTVKSLPSGSITLTVTFNITRSGTVSFFFGNRNGDTNDNVTVTNIMLVKGSVAYHYQPYNANKHITNEEAKLLANANGTNTEVYAKYDSDGNVIKNQYAKATELTALLFQFANMVKVNKFTGTYAQWQSSNINEDKVLAFKVAIDLNDDDQNPNYVYITAIKIDAGDGTANWMYYNNTAQQWLYVVNTHNVLVHYEE